MVGSQEFNTSCTDASPRVTVHDATYCVNNQPPSPPPSAGVDAGARSVSMAVTFLVEGTIEQFGTAEIDAILQSYITTLGASFAGTTASATGASVNLKMETTTDGSSANSAGDSVNSQFSSLSSINSALGVNALSLPTIEFTVLDGAADNTGLIVGATVGGVVGGLAILGAVFYFVRKGKKVEA